MPSIIKICPWVSTPWNDVRSKWHSSCRTYDCCHVLYEVQAEAQEILSIKWGTSWGWRNSWAWNICCNM